VNRRVFGLHRVRELAQRWLSPGEVSPRYNQWNLYRDIAWYGVLSGVSATFTGVFALRLGASNLLVGLLSSLPALINVIVQLPAARLIERERDRKRLLVVSGFLSRLPVLLIALVPWLPRFPAEAVVYITALGTIPGAAANVAFTAMLADVVAPQYRAHVVSVRNMLLSVVTTITVLGAGQALDVLPFPVGYQLIFVVAFVASLVSLYYLGRIVIPDSQPAGPAAAEPGRSDALAMARKMLAQRSYVRFTVGAFLLHWAIHFPIPLYVIYRVRVLGISEGWIGTLSMVESAVTIVSYYFWGRIAERYGHRLVLLVGLVGVCFYPIGTALSASAYPLLIVSFVSGVFAPAFALALFNGLLEVVPAERRATYVAAFNTLLNVPAFVAPILATAMAERIGVRTTLWIGGAARVVGLLMFAYLLSEFPFSRRGVRSAAAGQ
jgi:MFS family permease